MTLEFSKNIRILNLNLRKTLEYEIEFATNTRIWHLNFRKILDY